MIAAFYLPVWVIPFALWWLLFAWCAQDLWRDLRAQARRPYDWERDGA